MRIEDKITEEFYHKVEDPRLNKVQEMINEMVLDNIVVRKLMYFAKERIFDYIQVNESVA